MIQIFRLWIVCAIFMVFLSLAAAVDAKDDVKALWEQWGEPGDYDEQWRKSGVKREFWERFARMHLANKVRIKIETISTCEPEHLDSTGCHAPEIIMPRPNVPDAPWATWDFEKQYTVTWGNVNDSYPQQFQWHNDFCGGLNKTLNTGQRSFTFTFKELASEYPKSQCDYTTSEFLTLADSTHHSLFVEQPLHPASLYGYRAAVALWTARSKRIFLEAQVRRPEKSDRLEL